jgi:hypothetical protein
MGGSTHSQRALDELEHPRYDEVKDELLLPSKDNRIILLKQPTICLARLKATELTSLIKSHKIVHHFKTALDECRDVTESEFPNLYKANVSKLTKKSQKKIMIFVVRLHFAIYVLKMLRGKKGLKWDFATFPELQQVMAELEFDLTMVEKLDEHKPSPKMPIMTNGRVPTSVMEIITELASIVQSREVIVKELDYMKESIVRVQTSLEAAFYKGLLKKEPKEGTDSE